MDKKNPVVKEHHSKSISHSVRSVKNIKYICLCQWDGTFGLKPRLRPWS